MPDFNVKVVTVPVVKAVVVSGPTGPQGSQGPAGPPTTDASLMTSGTLPDARLSNNVVKVSDLLSELSTQLDTNTEIHSIQRVIGAVPEYDGTTFIWSDWANLELFALADGSLIGSNSTTIYGSTL